MSNNVTIVQHSLIQHKLTLMRDKNTACSQFRQLLREIGALLTYEFTKDLALDSVTIDTPLSPMKAPVIAGKKLTIVSILRAGNGLLDGVLDVMPSVRIGHIGIYRDHETLKPVEYLFRMPSDINGRDVVILDPMLATGNTASYAVERIKSLNPRTIKFVSLLAAPEGLTALHTQHPEVAIITAAVDQRLNDKGYIIPGLGDVGDRLYGTT